jgi:hypothetical protein
MLIRVVQAVNDFILLASFSEKTIGGDVRQSLRRRFLAERGDSVEDCALSAVLSTSGPGFGRAFQGHWLSLLLFYGFSFNCLF